MFVYALCFVEFPLPQPQIVLLAIESFSPNHEIEPESILLKLPIEPECLNLNTFRSIVFNLTTDAHSCYPAADWQWHTTAG
jgi:hypothetical protein